MQSALHKTKWNSHKKTTLFDFKWVSQTLPSLSPVNQTENPASKLMPLVEPCRYIEKCVDSTLRANQSADALDFSAY